MLPLLLLVTTLGSTPAPSPERSGYALVITNNRSLELSRPDLHYADDDGAKYADLLRELAGPTGSD